MNSNLRFDFSVDKNAKTIHVARQFSAPLPLVWKAWTTAELLDQWWAPAPWTAETQSMDFRNGGHWHYAMVSPEGDKHYAKAFYQTIVPEQSVTAKDTFSDAAGNVAEALPQNLTEQHFSATGDQTQVDITLRFEDLKDLETTIEMGFKEGFTAGLQNLDVLLEKLQSAGA